MSRTLLTLCVCWVLASSTGVAMADSVTLSRAEFDAALKTLQADKTMLALAEKSGDPSLPTALRKLATREGDLGSEQTLYNSVLKLSANSPSRELQAVVSDLAQRPVQILVSLDEAGHAPTLVPEFDVAAAAQWKLSQWASSDYQQTVSGQLLKGQLPQLPPNQLAKSQQRGMLQAFVDADTAQLSAIRNALALKLSQNNRYAPLAIETAFKLGDTTLLDQALSKGTAKDTQQAILRIEKYYSSSDTIQLLKNAAERPATGSLALHTLAAFAPTDSDVVDLLFSKLASEELGGSAASALARNGTHYVGRLEEKLNDADAVVRKRAALALFLMQEDTAKTALRKYLADPNADRVIVEEVSKWLVD